MFRAGMFEVSFGQSDSATGVILGLACLPSNSMHIIFKPTESVNTPIITSKHSTSFLCIPPGGSDILGNKRAPRGQGL